MSGSITFNWPSRQSDVPTNVVAKITKLNNQAWRNRAFLVERSVAATH